MLVTDTARLCLWLARARTRTRTWTLAAFAASVAVVGVLAPPAAAHAGGCPYAHRPVSVSTPRQMRQAVVCLINRQRRSRGLPALRVSRRLNRSAQGWTDQMVSSGDFTHGTDFAGRISAVGFVWSSAGENIAAGYTTPAGVVSGWMASTGHCQNILSPTFAFVGTGVSAGAIGSLGAGPGTWTQDFGLPMGWRAPSGDYGPADGCPY